MMTHYRVWGLNRSLGLTALALGVLVLAAPAVRSQGRRADDTERLNPDGKLEENDKKVLQKLAAGREEPTESHKKIFDRAAQWFVYRLTFSEYQFKNRPEGAGGDPTTMKNLVDDLTKYLVVADPKKPLNDWQKQYMKAFSVPLVAAIKKVLVNTAPIARVNAGIMLSRLAESGLPELAKPLCEVVTGKEYDAMVKLYGLVGLKNLFEAQAYKEDTPEGEIRYRRLKPEEDEERCIQVLLDFLARKPAYSAKAAPEEVDAFRYIRREAIRALGAIRLPAVIQAGAPTAMPALALARIVANPDSLTPPASLSERLEAAIGLCQVRNRLSPARNPYQQDYAAYLIGHFLVAFGTQADAERGDASSRVDWKYSAYRLNLALADLLKDSQGRSPYIKELVGRGQRLAQSVRDGKQAEGLATLSDALAQRKPQVLVLFRDLENTAVKVQEPAAEK